VKAIEGVPQLVAALLARAKSMTCADATYPDRCLKRKAILIKCANADNPERCLEKHAVQLKCLKDNVADVQACIAANADADPTTIVNNLLNNSVGDSLGGLGGLP